MAEKLNIYLNKINKFNFLDSVNLIRKYLKDRHIYKKVPVIYSKECNEKFMQDKEYFISIYSENMGKSNSDVLFFIVVAFVIFQALHFIDKL